MGATLNNQWTITKTDSHLLIWIEAFLFDRKAQNMSGGTLQFYRSKLALFAAFCDRKVITNIEQLTPGLIREYLVDLDTQGHNPGGIHACYRALKAFLRWFEDETEPDGWINPIRKVKAPLLSVEALDPAGLDVIQAMIDTCKHGEFIGERDRAILAGLLDTGARAQEFLSLNMGDVNQVTGALLIRHGKGRKSRSVFFGRQSRKALRNYLKFKPEGEALWMTEPGERLTYWGLREIIRRRARLAKVQAPQLHAFRRAFALNCLRNGMDIYSLQALMGHADLQVLRRYLKQSEEDLQIAHSKAGPVDRM